MRSIAFKILVCCLLLPALGSCTYDYFEDEMNYKVFVPEFKDKLVTDCRVTVWNKATGALAGDIYARVGQTGNNVIDAGIFPFKLPAGEYKTSVVTNTDSVTFTDLDDLGFAAFSLNRKPGGLFKQPAMMHCDYIGRVIDQPSVLVCDTAHIYQYPAKITVRYRGNTVSDKKCTKAHMSLLNIGTSQPISLDTLTAGGNDRRCDYWFENLEPYPISAEGARFEVSGLLFPSVENETTRLQIEYKDAENAILGKYIISLTTKESKPLRFLHGEHVIIDIYNEGITITLIGWNENIIGGDVDLNSGPSVPHN